MTATMTEGDTLVRDDLDIREDTQHVEPGDHDRFSHYVPKNSILLSAMSGDPIKALCGKVWTPGRDPEKFPVCQECKERYEEMQE